MSIDYFIIGLFTNLNKQISFGQIEKLHRTIFSIFQFCGIHGDCIFHFLKKLWAMISKNTKGFVVTKAKIIHRFLARFVQIFDVQQLRKAWNVKKNTYPNPPFHLFQSIFNNLKKQIFKKGKNVHRTFMELFSALKHARKKSFHFITKL